MFVPTRTAVQAAKRLKSQPVCNILIKDIIGPVQQNNWNISAFRMSWSRTGTDEKTVWDQIVLIREELDTLAKDIPGALFFVSAINATTTQIKGTEKISYKVAPAVAYWFITDETVLTSRDLCDHMNNNRWGATLKLVLQPYHTADKDIQSALFNAVKDNTAGCVRNLVEDSCERCFGPSERTREPLVKFYVAKHGPVNMLRQVVGNLAAVRFRADLIEINTEVH